MIKRWLLYFIPALLISFVFLYVGAAIGGIIGMGHGSDFTASTMLLNVPLFLFSLAGYFFYNYSKKLIASFFWVPIITFLYSLILITNGAYLIGATILILYTTLYVVKKQTIAKN